VTAKPLGMADDFYRLRVIHVDSSGSPELDWRDDILYRDPPASEPTEADTYTVQAVELEDEEETTALASFSDAEEARAWLEEAQESLEELTRSEFELRFFRATPAGPEGAVAPRDLQDEQRGAGSPE
jgi:hypothetical protein